MELEQFVKAPRVMAIFFEDNGRIPNNPRFPLLIYKGALELKGRRAARHIEELIESNCWGGSWRNGIYEYHHYHSTAHEVLIVYKGSATVQFGGEGGSLQTIAKGDAVVIPAGVGHKNVGTSRDFAIVGAYPAGQEWDLCYGEPGERPRTDHNIARVDLPRSDPIYGESGPLLERWKTV